MALYGEAEWDALSPEEQQKARDEHYPTPILIWDIETPDIPGVPSPKRDLPSNKPTA